MSEPVRQRADEVTARWAESDVRAGDVGLHVYRAGRADRPPLVFAHGLGDSGRCWWRVAAALEDDADLIMIDARHHGRSSSPASPSLVAHRRPGAWSSTRSVSNGQRSWATPSGREPSREFAATHPGSRRSTRARSIHRGRLIARSTAICGDVGTRGDPRLVELVRRHDRRRPGRARAAAAPRLARRRVRHLDRIEAAGATRSRR